MSEIDENENEFRDIPNFEGLYQINRKGVVKSLERYVDDKRYGNRLLKEKIKKPWINKNGYFTIGLSKNNKTITITIHKLLYNTFIGDYDTRYFEIDHFDRNRLNNNLDTNLRLVYNRDNSNNRTDQSLYGCGVKFDKRHNVFSSRIHINKIETHLGQYKNIEQAHQKYLSVKQQIEEIEKVTRNYDFKRSKIGKEYFIEFFPIL